MSLLVKTNHYQ